MIVTVTMNPAIDKTIELDKFVHGGLNRISNPVVDAGGKGINVSKTIQNLGGESIATGFLGDEGKEIILNYLNKHHIKNDFVIVDGVTRTNMKIMESDGSLTEVNEQGMIVPEKKVDELIEKLLSYAGKDTLFVLAGSIPQGVSTDIYANITFRLKEKGANVFVDADGALFRETLKAVPSMIKPNQVELTEYFQVPEDSSEEVLLELGETLLKEGVKAIAISRGKDGALFLFQDHIYRCEGLKVEVHSTVGAGDAMVAALCYAWDKGDTQENCIRLSVATSAGAVTTVGTRPPELSLVNELQKKVKIEKIK